MKFYAIIPARYASTRFPAKPLACLAGKPIIQHVYERVSKVITDTYVATDDKRISDAVERFGGRVIMTASTHPSGTDRCQEAYEKIKAMECASSHAALSPHYNNKGEEAPANTQGGTTANVADDIVINVQGDEPFIHPSQLQSLMDCFAAADTQIATLVKPFTADDGLTALKNPNSPKVVVGSRKQALYFSRSVIPYLRNYPEEEWLQHHTFYKHIGIYAYRAEVLRQITAMPQGILEKNESLEQLRWLEAGLCIRVGTTDIETIGIDTPADLERAELFLQH